jgi:hypothetical protein
MYNGKDWRKCREGVWAEGMELIARSMKPEKQAGRNLASSAVERPPCCFKWIGVLKTISIFFGLKARGKAKRRHGIIDVENGCAL